MEAVETVVDAVEDVVEVDEVVEAVVVFDAVDDVVEIVEATKMQKFSQIDHYCRMNVQYYHCSKFTKPFRFKTHN